MIKKITFFFLVCITTFGFAQTVVNDFETGSPVPVKRYGAEISVVANPNTTGNTSANVAKLGRTTSLWYELMAFDLATAYTVPAGEIRYFTFMANYPAQPDITIRFNAADASVDGSGSQRALNKYTATAGEWQEIVFELDGGTNGITINAIIFIGDAGFQNDPKGLVLNNTDKFAYVDNFTFKAQNPLSTKNFSLENNTSVYPNEVTSTFKIDLNNSTKISDISLFNILGKNVTHSLSKISDTEYDASNLSTGLYLLRIQDQNGNNVTKKILKK
ncbi:T9SS type A sorting domain-containing protein [Polaribacter porphyrae]|uniref:Secretion system C-terminal sorting domain-containing protein n=1 Tax=Polaribacter porphyrae TaxID=1137780 RepID=A0A2S7WPW0_9FLAO|nr:T9SS type A sorting domain-containing protein [Polaribacter porphyrae]PQJ79614.1 hypothetical protein BTO18_10715 [Polaribacter porphyrae]